MNYLNKIHKLRDMYKLYEFEIFFIICFLFLFMYAIYRRNKKGTWNIYNVTIQKKNNIHTSHEEIEKINYKNKGDSSGETECRRVLEKIFKKKFDKKRPDFLRNPITGNNFNLELDCYNEELRLAVEYQGCQHYKYIPFFHKNKEAFYNQKYRDLFKRQKCVENKITLIEVPYTVKNKNIEFFLINKLKNIN